MHVKLKSSPGIYLVGFMGCGKTTVGEALADRLGWDFVDVDAQIEQRATTKISDIFEKHGEPAFRVLERQAVVEQVHLVLQGRARVVALGGGTFTDERNRQTLGEGGVSIWLDAPVETLWKRVSDETHRPLAQEREAFVVLYEKRRPAYAKADFTIQAGSQSAEQVVEEILSLSLI